MKKSVKQEVEQLIKELSLNCSVNEFKDNVDWNHISISQKLSEDFIREFKDQVNWGCISCYQKLSEDFIREFKDKVYWDYISYNQKLSEDFIREFKDKVNWNHISYNQKLSEDFIREFKDKVYWCYISIYQKLSEDFIREFKDKVNWNHISIYQKLSEDFIREFQNKVNWNHISIYQKLSEDFIREFQVDDKIIVNLQREIHAPKSIETKLKEIKEYAENKHNLKYDNEYLYAFRDHDKYGRGIYNKTISYEKGKYYQDWHCDMRENEKNSFGFGIWPEGNTPVKVKIEDWGVAVKADYAGKAGKARVMGFEIIA